MTRRPIREAPTTPMVSPCVPSQCWRSRSAPVRWVRRVRNSPASGNTRFAPMMIAARVYSATGTALAAAAEETTIPRSNAMGDRNVFTVPAAWITARSPGARSSSAASTGGSPSR